MEKEKFSFYRDWQKSLKGLPDEQKLELYNAIVDYGLDGVESAVSPIVNMAMTFIKAQIDRNDERIKLRNEKLRENGKLGGRPKKNQKVSEKPNGLSVNQENQKVSEKPNGSNVNINNDINVNMDKPIKEAIASSSFTDDADVNLDDGYIDCDGERLDTRKLMEFWNLKVKGTLIPKLTSIQGTRRKLLKARMSTYHKKGILEAIEKVAASDYLTGRSDRYMKHFSFDWMIRPNNFPKVIEGNYDNRPNDNLDGNGFTENNSSVQREAEQRQRGYAQVAADFFNESQQELTSRDSESSE